MSKQVASGVILFFIVQLGFSQAKRAESYFASMQYEEAIPFYLKAIKKGQDSALVVHLAESYRLIHDYENAELFYKKAAELFPNNAEVQVKYGQALKSNSKLDQAKEVFVVYANRNPKDASGQNYLLSCDRVRSWAVFAPGYAIENEEMLNSTNSDFSPMPFGNGVAFVSDRFGNNSDATGQKGVGFLSVSFAEMKEDSTFKKAKSISSQINSEFHNGPICFSQDQSETYFTRVGYDRKKGKDFVNKPQIFVSKLEGGKWGKARSFEHNDPNYTLSQPALSVDGSTLFFASNMAGTLGGLDIFYCKRDGEGWSAPINIGDKINTKDNEMFPTATNNALYFSSNGHIGFGALDIFRAKLNNGNWGEVENLKAPINSPRDDFGLVFTDEKNGFFSSNRKGGKGGDDIYSFELTSTVSKKTEISGVFLYSELDPAKSSLIQLFDEDGDMIQETTTKEDGSFSFVGLEPDKNYEFRIDNKDSKLSDSSQIFLTNAEGEKIVALGQLATGEFHFRALEPEKISNLEVMTVEDIRLTFVDIFGQLYDVLPGDYHEGMEVFLVDDDGKIIYTTTANKNGNFEFKNLLSDQAYKIRLSNDTRGVTLIYTDEEGKKTGDALKVDEQHYIFLNQDIAVQKTANIFGKIYQELPGDYSGGMEVYLVDDDGQIIYTATSDAKGEFNFENLPVDEHYAIKLKELDAEYKILMLDEVGEPQEVLKLTENGDFQYDSPNLEDKSMFGKVYEALPGDYSEGMEVYLVDEDGKIMYTTKLDKEGNFNFENLPPDQNFMVRIQEAGKDLNMIVLNERGEVESKAKQTPEGDFEYERPKDADRTGLFGNIFKELPGDFSGGLEVYLVDDRGNILYTTITDDDGNFNFENLPADHNYKIQLKDVEQEFSMVILNEEGELKPVDKADSGYFVAQEEKRTLLGNIYQTLPGDFKAGMEVYLLDDDGNVVYTAITDASGNFEFENLPADKHFAIQIKDAPDDINMVVLNEKGEMQTSAKANTDGVFNPEPAQPKNESIFGKAYQELPGDFTAGMEVYLFDDAGNIVYTTTTDQNGDFVFENLPSDKHYAIKFNEEDTQMKVLFTDEEGEEVGTATADASGGFEYAILEQKKEYISLLTANDAIIKIIEDPNYVMFTIYFDYDNFNVQGNSKAELDKLAELMIRNPHISIKISAYADSKGSDDYNLKLTQKRANQGKNYIINKGISLDRIEVAGYGEQRPIAPNMFPDGKDNPKGRAKNRRAEIQILRT